MNNDKSIEFVKRFLIPFVNAKTDKEKLESFREIVKNGIGFLRNKDYMLDESVTQKLDIEQINIIHTRILKMLRIALVNGEFDRLYPEIKDLEIPEEFYKLNDLELYINKSICYLYQKTFYLWRGRGLNFNTTDAAIFSDVYIGIEAVIIQLIINLFECELVRNKSDKSKNKVLNEVVYAIGYQYFAICPKCGKFFYKKRKDMVFDSEKCRLAESQKRFRVRNKTK